MVRLTRTLAACAVSATVTVMISVAPALADGRCGRHDASGGSACPINHAGTYRGALVPRYNPFPSFPERDYFVLRAAAGTRLSVTVTDQENQSCQSTDAFLFCGTIHASLVNGDGKRVASTKKPATVHNGISVPATLTKALGRGTYYLIVTGGLPRNATPEFRGQREQRLLYSLTCSAKPTLRRSA